MRKTQRGLAVLLALCLALAGLPLSAGAQGSAVSAGASKDLLAPFEDLRPEGWYADGVAYALENRLFYGATATQFKPNAAMTRAMAVCVLWRLAGEPVPQGRLTFTDVPAGSYYADAVVWASENGMVSGVGENRFNPTGNITREQLAALLYRYAAKMNLVTHERVSLAAFPEEEKVSSYAREALSWLLARRVMNGVLDHGLTFLDPSRSATRAQVAVTMMNFQRLVLEGGAAPGETLIPEGTLRENEQILWIDGERFQGCLTMDGKRYVSLTALARFLGAELARGANMVLTYKDRKFFLAPGSEAVWEGGRFFLMGSGVTRRGYEYYAPADGLLQALGHHVLEDAAWKQVYYTAYPSHDEIPQGISIPVLRYHAVGDASFGDQEVFIQPELLEQHLAALNREGCTSITFEDLGHADRLYRPVLVTFDDGYRNNYTELFPLLKKYGIKVTIFLITDNIGKERFLTEDMIREMAASGLVSFQSHTVNHFGLDGMSADGLDYQTRASQLAVARIIGKAPFVFSYPEARNTDAASVYVKKYYEFSVYKDGAKYVTGTDPYSIPRYGMPWGTDVDTFLKAIR